MAGTRIPATIDDFNRYINETDDHLRSVRPDDTPVYISLGIDDEDMDEWSSRRKFWRDDLYKKWSKKSTKSPTVNKKVETFLKDFQTFGQPVLDIAAASKNATQEDADILNFVLKRAAPTTPEEKIKEACNTTLTGLGGAEISAASRTRSDSSRASVADGAEGVQYAYSIGDVRPDSVNETDTLEFFSGSTHTFVLGDENKKKSLYMWTRWYNPKYPEFAGPWTVVAEAVIA